MKYRYIWNNNEYIFGYIFLEITKSDRGMHILSLYHFSVLSTQIADIFFIFLYRYPLHIHAHTHNYSHTHIHIHAGNTFQKSERLIYALIPLILNEQQTLILLLINKEKMKGEWSHKCIDNRHVL